MVPEEELRRRNHSDYHDVDNFAHYKSVSDYRQNERGDKQFKSLGWITLALVLVVAVAYLWGVVF